MFKARSAASCCGLVSSWLSRRARIIVAEWMGWLNAPGRVWRAAAPPVLGTALAAWGLGAVRLPTVVGVPATAGRLILRR
jgi:hypothetical protein